MPAEIHSGPFSVMSTSSSMRMPMPRYSGGNQQIILAEVQAGLDREDHAWRMARPDRTRNGLRAIMHIKTWLRRRRSQPTAVLLALRG